MTISDTLKKHIETCGLSHRQLSIQSGVDRRCIGRFMKGEIDLSLASVDALAAFFGLELKPATRQRGRKGE
jgi:DNA transposition AAA+ family ATPase